MDVAGRQNVDKYAKLSASRIDYMGISVDFRAYLEYFGLSQASFAKLIDVTPDTVSRWKGKPPKLVMLFLVEKYDRAEDTSNLKKWIAGHMG